MEAVSAGAESAEVGSEVESAAGAGSEEVTLLVRSEGRPAWIMA